MTSVGQKLHESHEILDRAGDELDFGRCFCAFSGQRRDRLLILSPPIGGDRQILAILAAKTVYPA